VILTYEGPEHSQPKTKSVLTAIEALILFAIEFSDSNSKNELTGSLEQACAAIEKIFEAYEEPIKAFAYKYKDQTDILLAGAGVHYGTAIEAALKLKETCGIHSEGMSTGEVAQGPVLVLNPNWLYITFVSGAGANHAMKMLRGATFKKAVKMVLTPEPAKVGGAADMLITMPKLDSEIFMPLVYLVPLHLLTYYISQARGLDADDPKDFDMVLELILEPGRTEPEMAKK
jgi:glucosamine--fructose-6-phosphate aminotransferase (isomerizing)